MRDFLKQRKQRVVFNGQFSTWKNVNTGVPQGSILGPLFSSNAKLFADDTSLFSVIHVIQTSANNLNKDFTQWKMNFNPDTTKQAKDDNFLVAN